VLEILVTLDVPAESIRAFRVLCAEHGIKILHYDEMLLSFNVAVHDAKALGALAKFYWLSCISSPVVKALS
jgi:hypothetical protein